MIAFVEYANGYGIASPADKTLAYAASYRDGSQRQSIKYSFSDSLFERDFPEMVMI